MQREEEREKPVYRGKCCPVARKGEVLEEVIHFFLETIERNPSAMSTRSIHIGELGQPVVQRSLSSIALVSMIDPLIVVRRGNIDSIDKSPSADRWATTIDKSKLSSEEINVSSGP